jgi:hypothetical protein
MVETEQKALTQQQLIAQVLEEVRELAAELKEARDSDTALALSTRLRKKVQELRRLVIAARNGADSENIEPQVVRP